MTSLRTSQRCLRYLSNETPNDISLERRQDILVVRLHDVLLVCHDDVSRERNDNVPSVRLHDFSNKCQMKHPITSLWYVSTTPRSYVVAFSLLRSLLRFQIALPWSPSGSFSSFIYTLNQTPHFFSTNQEGNKKSSVYYKLVELLLHLETASYINSISNISCVDT